MSSLNCPTCKKRCADTHCKSPTCTWKVCKVCKIAFSKGGRSMAVRTS